MKAVYWHADSHFAWGPKVQGQYQRIAENFQNQCRQNGIKTVHLTTPGHWTVADETIRYELDPHNVVANREEAFSSFLEAAEDDWYWFTEPDTQIIEMFQEPRDCDCVMLWRNDEVSMCPAFRIARKSALPFFHEIREAMRADPRKDWHGDSAAIVVVHKAMGSPGIGNHEYKGMKFQFWDYTHFIKPGKYTRNRLGPQKLSGG